MKKEQLKVGQMYFDLDTFCRHVRMVVFVGLKQEHEHAVIGRLSDGKLADVYPHSLHETAAEARDAIMLEVSAMRHKILEFEKLSESLKTDHAEHPPTGDEEEDTEPTHDIGNPVGATK